MLNQITIQGRLTADPELKKTSNDISVTSFGIACDRDYGAKGDKTTDFFDVEAWRGTAEFIANYFGKGKPIIISGSLLADKWKDRDGNIRVKYKIQADRAYFCEGKKDGAKDDTAGYGNYPRGAAPGFDPFS